MDRQDIDALLIGALYGELTPADEARLAAHLDSHPADRGALDDLKTARQAVRESRIFELQLDPPQAVSALLLQEAHRRAPKHVVVSEREGWFARFTRSFMAHPAMAAAAMLVLVVGVAGTLYMKKGHQLAEKTAPSAPVLAQESGSAAMAHPASDTVEAVVASDAGVPYQVGLVEGADDSAAKAGAKDKALANERSRRDELAEQRAKLEQVQKKAETNKVAHGITVETKRPMPKELDDAKGTTSLGFDGEAPSAPGRGAGGGATAGAAPPRAQALSPPPATTTAPAAPKATAKPEPPADPNLVAWSKQTHKAAVQAVQNGDCKRAASLALAVNNRDPDYYAAYMAFDRDLKGCQQYIADERNRDAEQRQKARASKKTNAADESYAPSAK